MHPFNLNYLIKTKWIKRFLNFWRLFYKQPSSPDITIGNYEWSPLHFNYIECGCNLFSTLINNSEGLNYLLNGSHIKKNDSSNSGMIFSDIANQLDQILSVGLLSYQNIASINITINHSNLPSSLYSGQINNLFNISAIMNKYGLSSSDTSNTSQTNQNQSIWLNSIVHNIMLSYRLSVFNTSLARETFTLISRILNLETTINSSQLHSYSSNNSNYLQSLSYNFLESTGIPSRLIKLGALSPKFDYLIRGIVTSLLLGSSAGYTDYNSVITNYFASENVLNYYIPNKYPTKTPISQSESVLLNDLLRSWLSPSAATVVFVDKMNSVNPTGGKKSKKKKENSSTSSSSSSSTTSSSSSSLSNRISLSLKLYFCNLLSTLSIISEHHPSNPYRWSFFLISDLLEELLNDSDNNNQDDYFEKYIKYLHLKKVDEEKITDDFEIEDRDKNKKNETIEREEEDGDYLSEDSEENEDEDSDYCSECNALFNYNCFDDFHDGVLDEEYIEFETDNDSNSDEEYIIGNDFLNKLTTITEKKDESEKLNKLKKRKKLVDEEEEFNQNFQANKSIDKVFYFNRINTNIINKKKINFNNYCMFLSLKNSLLNILSSSPIIKLFIHKSPKLLLHLIFSQQETIYNYINSLSTSTYHESSLSVNTSSTLDSKKKIDDLIYYDINNVSSVSFSTLLNQPKSSISFLLGLQTILLKILSTEEGIELLLPSGIISKTLREWNNIFSLFYVKNVEENIENLIIRDSNKQINSFYFNKSNSTGRYKTKFPINHPFVAYKDEFYRYSKLRSNSFSNSSTSSPSSTSTNTSNSFEDFFINSSTCLIEEIDLNIEPFRINLENISNLTVNSTSNNKNIWKDSSKIYSNNNTLVQQKYQLSLKKSVIIGSDKNEDNKNNIFSGKANPNSTSSSINGTAKEKKTLRVQNTNFNTYLEKDLTSYSEQSYYTLEIQKLISLPWNIEAKIAYPKPNSLKSKINEKYTSKISHLQGHYLNPPNGNSSCTTTSICNLSNISEHAYNSSILEEHLTLDTYLDTSSLPNLFQNEINNKNNRILFIRSQLINKEGDVVGRLIGNNMTISTTLSIGACPINIPDLIITNDVIENSLKKMVKKKNNSTQNKNFNLNVTPTNQSNTLLNNNSTSNLSMNSTNLKTNSNSTTNLKVNPSTSSIKLDSSITNKSEAFTTKNKLNIEDESFIKDYLIKDIEEINNFGVKILPSSVLNSKKKIKFSYLTSSSCFDNSISAFFSNDYNPNLYEPSIFSKIEKQSYYQNHYQNHNQKNPWSPLLFFDKCFLQLESKKSLDFVPIFSINKRSSHPHPINGYNSLIVNINTNENLEEFYSNNEEIINIDKKLSNNSIDSISFKSLYSINTNSKSNIFDDNFGEINHTNLNFNDYNYDFDNFNYNFKNDFEKFNEFENNDNFLSLNNSNFILGTESISPNLSSNSSNFSSNLSTSPNQSEYDIPLTYGIEEQFQWFHCKPSQRLVDVPTQQSNSSHNIYILEDKHSKFNHKHFNKSFSASKNQTENYEQIFLVTHTKAPVIFVFLRRPLPQCIVNYINDSKHLFGSTHNQSQINLQKLYCHGNIQDFQPCSTFYSNNNVLMGLYLIEIRYALLLETFRPPVSNLPLHIHGVLSQTTRGCMLLNQYKVIPCLILRARKIMKLLNNHNEYHANLSKNSQNNKSYQNNLNLIVSPTNLTYSELNLMLRSHLWSIANIAKSDGGIELIIQYDNTFFDWCVNNLKQNEFFNLRATFYHLILLSSRSTRGEALLNQSGWVTSNLFSFHSIIYPNNLNSLFSCKNLVNSSNLKLIFNEKLTNPINKILNNIKIYHQFPTLAQEIIILICKVSSILLFFPLF